MNIASISETDYADFLALVNAEIRPDRAKTNAWDDFPLILSPENREWCLGAYTEDGNLAGGIACLIRNYKTSCGVLPIAGIGSVVTKSEFRGQGLSSSLQNEMLSRLRRKKVPLAVLWTDKPEIYAGRGFTSAGYEFHIDFTEAAISGTMEPLFKVEEFLPQHIPAVENQFLNHPYHCLRDPGDSRHLYTMPGTRGFVVLDSNEKVKAYVFCGKGGDFPSYVVEWGGELTFVLPLLYKVREMGLAHQILVPAGTTHLAEHLIEAGAQWIAAPSGYWAVVNKHVLSEHLGSSIQDTVSEKLGDPTIILGSVKDGEITTAGLIELAIWGFDSV